MGSLGALVARTTNRTPISWQEEEIQYFQGLWKKFELPNKDVIEPEGAGYVTADQQTKSKWSFQPQLPKVARFPERIAVRKLEHIACHLCHRENFTLSGSYSQLVLLA
jgi:hypothetical protein